MLPSEVRHDVRNQLHTLGLGAQLLQHAIARGRLDDAKSLLGDWVGHLDRLTEHPAFSGETAAGNLEKTAREASATCRVLVVEDDGNQRELLAGILRMQEHRVATAGDGDEALQWLASNETPDLILLDMRMPRRHGASLLEHIGADSRFQATKVFAVSGHTPEESGVSLVDSGIDRWFVKPLNPRPLLEAIAAEVSR